MMTWGRHDQACTNKYCLWGGSVGVPYNLEVSVYDIRRKIILLSLLAKTVPSLNLSMPTLPLQHPVSLLHTWHERMSKTVASTAFARAPVDGSPARAFDAHPKCKLVAFALEQGHDCQPGLGGAYANIPQLDFEKLHMGRDTSDQPA